MNSETLINILFKAFGGIAPTGIIRPVIANLVKLKPELPNIPVISYLINAIACLLASETAKAVVRYPPDPDDSKPRTIQSSFKSAAKWMALFCRGELKNP